MCGIVGIHARANEADRLASWLHDMNVAQYHRGPDGEGTLIDQERSLGLAMRRLSIVDIAGGAQPMHSPDGRFTLVYNGEIMNAPELRASLEDRGVSFSSDHSDTEVLLHLLIQDGVAALSQLNGMFAFALYDRDHQTLTLARDRFGIKPLYIWEDQGRFAFASELKSLLALPILSRALNTQSLHHYLSLMYVPGRDSILSGVTRLPVGHVLTYSLTSRQADLSSWWALAYQPAAQINQREWVERVRFTLSQAVRRWTMSDVPVACSLSGGLDSSAIVGILSQNGSPPATYSLGFRGDGEAGWDELPLAATVAKQWGTDHHEIVLTPDSLLSELAKMVWSMDEPYGGGLPSWSVFKAMGEDVKVGLIGSGGDELFGNYGKWIGLEGRWWKRPQATAESFRAHFFNQFYYFPDADKRRYLTCESAIETDTSDFLWQRYQNANGATVRDRCASVDIETQFTDEFLMMTDRFSMAHSLEALPPFLDNDLVDLVTNIPADQRTRRRDLKGLLRKAVAPFLPPELLTAPKKGFVIPLDLWMRGPLKGLASHLLSRERLEKQGLFRGSLFDELVSPHLEGQITQTTRVWGLLMFQLWHLQTFEVEKSSGPLDLKDLV